MVALDSFQPRAAQFSAEQLLSPEQIRRMDSEVPCLQSKSYLGRFGMVWVFLDMIGHFAGWSCGE